MEQPRERHLLAKRTGPDSGRSTSWVLSLGGLLLLCATSLGGAHAQGNAGLVQLPPLRAGQQQTVLPDGSLLLTGLPGGVIPTTGAAVRNPKSGAVLPLASGPNVPRSWHSATVLPDGSVLLVGGVDTSGNVLGTMERFDPALQTFAGVDAAPLLPRARHAAVLLTDGTVLIVGGTSERGTPVLDAERWNPRTQSDEAVSAALPAGRIAPSATLLSDGSVWITGGTGIDGQAVSGGQRFDPTTQRITTEAQPPAELAQTPAAALAQASPQHDEQNFPVDGLVALRFTTPLRIDSLNTASVRLQGPKGDVQAIITGAEGGMLLFVSPRTPLQPDTTYQLSVANTLDRGGLPLAPFAVQFTTGAAGDSDQAEQRGGANSGRASVQQRTQDALAELAGQRASLTGVLKTLDERALADVLIEVQGKRTRSDARGRFVLRNLNPGTVEVWIDARPANRPGHTYGTFVVGAELAAGELTEYPQVMWMPEIDTRHAMRITSPTAAEVIVTNPAMPNFELRIPAGTTIVDRYGKPVREVSVTPVPFGKIPFPMVEGYPFKSYYTIQPGGAKLINPQYKLARIFYPNWNNEKPGHRYFFLSYDPEKGYRGWSVYGQAEVSADRRQLIPEPGAGLYEFYGAGVVGGPTPPKPPCTDPLACSCPCANNQPAGSSPGVAGSPTAGEPVALSSGYFVRAETDIVIPDVIPLRFTRSYLSEDNGLRGTIGNGWTHNYELYLWRPSLLDWNQVAIIFPNGSRVYFTLVGGTDGHNGTWENNVGPAEFYKTRITSLIDPQLSYLWNLTLKDGTVWSFSGLGGYMQAITDRYGNRVTFTRSGVTGGILTRLVSPSGRWLEFSYTSTLISQIKDNTNRVWTYNYPGSSYLDHVVDPNGGVRYYTYDASAHRMLTVKDARNNIAITNEYWPDGRVKKQTFPDTTTYQFAYTIDGAGKVTQTDVTDQRGNVRRVQFNADGYVSSDVFALGTAFQQTYTFAYQAGTTFLTDATDAAGRVTHYTYDAKGNVASTTKMYGTGQAVTWNYTYEPSFNQIATVTDPLSHTTTFTYNPNGSPYQIQDALGHTTTFGTNPLGQITSVSDALSHATNFVYDGGDLVSVTDALSRTTNFYTDALGRTIVATDPLGNRSTTQYDVLDRVTRSTDALGNFSQYGYDPNSNLTSFTDPRSNLTQFTYDTMNRLGSRQDALVKTESYAYEPGGSLKQFTDRKNQVSGFTYDALGRKATAGFGATPANPTTYTNTITNTYDTANRLTQAADSVSGTITHAYDDRFDTLTQEVTPQGTVNTTYDAAGRRATMTVVGQTQVVYTFDNANRFTNVTQGAAGVTIGYDNANRRSTLTLPNGVVLTYGFDNANQLTGMTYTKGAATLGTLNYAYDNVGRRTSASGTLAATGLPTALASATYDANNRLTVWGGAALTYDDNGSVLAEGGKTYTWDSRNQLASISGGATASFQYDAFGRRPSKTIAGAQTGFVFDGINFVQEKAGATVTANLLTGLGADEAFSRTQGAATSTLLPDGLGSTIALTDSAGTVATQYSYEPYGKTTQTGAANANTQQFTGRESDGTTGLYYYRARYYHPTYGRFVTEDPIGFSRGPNAYLYADNDPIRGIDPSGLGTVFVAAGGSFIVGAGGGGSIGGYVTNKPDVDAGLFSTGEVGGGFDVGGSVTAGYVSGNRDNFREPTTNFNIAVSAVKVTVMVDPKTREIVGGAAGYAAEFGFSITHADTGTTSGIRDWFDRMFDRLAPYFSFTNAGPPAKTKTCP